jgi:hypothetical protein
MKTFFYIVGLPVRIILALLYNIIMCFVCIVSPESTDDAIESVKSAWKAALLP